MAKFIIRPPAKEDFARPPSYCFKLHTKKIINRRRIFIATLLPYIGAEIE
jgi:hypothetical protein